MMYIELQCAVILWSEPAQSNLYFNMSQATTNLGQGVGLRNHLKGMCN